MSSATMNHSVCQFSESSFYVSTKSPEKNMVFSEATVNDSQFKTSFYNPFEIKRRKRTSRAQFKVLEKTFMENPKPNASMRRWLAQQLDMTPRGVQVWFQNRRAKEKVSSTKRTAEPMVRTASYPTEDELLMTPVTPIVDLNSVIDTSFYGHWNLSVEDKIPPHVSYFTQQVVPDAFTEPRLFDPIFDSNLSFFNQYDLLERRHTC